MSKDIPTSIAEKQFEEHQAQELGEKSGNILDRAGTYLSQLLDGKERLKKEEKQRQKLMEAILDSPEAVAKCIEAAKKDKSKAENAYKEGMKALKAVKENDYAQIAIIAEQNNVDTSDMSDADLKRWALGYAEDKLDIYQKSEADHANKNSLVQGSKYANDNQKSQMLDDTNYLATKGADFKSYLNSVKAEAEMDINAINASDATQEEKNELIAEIEENAALNLQNATQEAYKNGVDTEEAFKEVRNENNWEIEVFEQAVGSMKTDEIDAYFSKNTDTPASDPFTSTSYANSVEEDPFAVSAGKITDPFNAVASNKGYEQTMKNEMPEAEVETPIINKNSVTIGI